MSFSLNKIQIIGYLGDDAEIKFTTSNIEVSNFSVATTHSYKKNDEWVNETTWHNCVLFQPTDYLKDNLVKGAKVYVEGRLTKRNYENKEGQKIYITEILVDKYSIIFFNDRPKPENKENNVEMNNTSNIDQENDDLPF